MQRGHWNYRSTATSDFHYRFRYPMSTPPIQSASQEFKSRTSTGKTMASLFWDTNRILYECFLTPCSVLNTQLAFVRAGERANELRPSVHWGRFRSRVNRPRSQQSAL
ncbi:hypothetical protein CBL_13660 [Carabus blaptoides fortunei]